MEYGWDDERCRCRGTGGPRQDAHPHQQRNDGAYRGESRSFRRHVRNANTIKDLVAWESGNIEDANSIKGVVGRYAAMVGPEVAKVAILDFSGH